MNNIRIDLLPPEQKVGGSNPLGRTMLSTAYKPTAFLRLPKTYPNRKLSIKAKNCAAYFTPQVYITPGLSEAGRTALKIS
jgi:hypothetical protein